MAEPVTLKIWHGGVFVLDKNREMAYLGAEGKTFTVAPNTVNLAELELLVYKCGDYGVVEGIYFLVPDCTLMDGLISVSGEDDVRDIMKVAAYERNAELYVHHLGKSPQGIRDQAAACVTNVVSPTKKRSVRRAQKLTPKRQVQPSQLRRSPRSKKSLTDSTISMSNVVPHSSSKIPTNTKNLTTSLIDYNHSLSTFDQTFEANPLTQQNTLFAKKTQTLK